MIRPASAEDQVTVAAIVAAAYSVYLERMDKRPGPMLDDYGLLIDQGAVSVTDGTDGTVDGLIVLLPQSDHLLLDNIAVRPDRQGRGIGRMLIEFAESEARRLGFSELRLYTHVTMTENIALYQRHGFVETGRGRQAGYDRVFMCKPLDSSGK